MSKINATFTRPYSFNAGRDKSKLAKDTITCSRRCLHTPGCASAYRGWCGSSSSSPRNRLREASVAPPPMYAHRTFMPRLAPWSCCIPSPPSSVCFVELLQSPPPPLQSFGSDLSHRFRAAHPSILSLAGSHVPYHRALPRTMVQQCHPCSSHSP